MKKFIHQLFAILMVLVMLFDAAPVAVLAEGEDTQLGAEVSASAESGNATGEANPVSRGGQLGIEKANYYLLDASEYTVTSVTGSFDRFLDPNYVPGNASQAEDTRGLSEGEDSAASTDDQQTQALAPSAVITPKLSKRSTPVLQTKDALGSVQTLNTKGVEAEPANDLSLNSVSDGESSAAPESPSATVEEPKASDTNAPAVPEPQQVKGLVAYEIELNEGVPFAKEYDYKVKVPVGVNMLKDVKEEPGKIIKINQVNYRLFHLHGETEEEITNVSVTQNDGIISNFTFTTEDFSTFVLVYTVENLQENSNKLSHISYDKIQKVTMFPVADIFADAPVKTDDEQDCSEVYVVYLHDGTAKEEFDKEFFSQAAVSIEGKGVEYSEGTIRLTGDVKEGKVTFTSGYKTLEVEISNYIAPPVVPEDAEAFTYRFFAVGETAAVADILAANEIVSSYYNIVSLSDEKAVTEKDGSLSAQDYFDAVTLTVALSDGFEVEIILSNPAPVKANETVITEGVGSFAADTEVPAGTMLVVDSNPKVPEGIVLPGNMRKGGSAESDPVFFEVSLVGPDGEPVRTGADVTLNTAIKLPEAPEGQIVKVTGVKVYHIGEKGDAEELKGATYALAEGKISSVSFTTPGFSLFAITYTVEYIEINYNGVINLDFTGFEPYPKEGVDATFIYDVISEKAEIENFEIDWTKVETVSAEGFVALEEGVLVISGDGSIVLSDGEKTLTINITGITKLSEEILKADGVEIKVEEGNIPLGSQAQYTQNSEEKTASLVEEHKLGEGEENIAGYSSADLKIVRNDEPVNAEGQFKVTLEKSSLIPEGMKLDKLYHIHDGEVEELTVAENDNGQLEFTLSDFSDIVASYTVDFEYNGIQYKMPGGEAIKLSEVFEKLHIDETILGNETVTFTDYSLLAIENIGEDWRIYSLKPFDTTEMLTIRMANGNLYELVVTDDQEVSRNLRDAVSVVTLDGQTVPYGTTLNVRPEDTYKLHLEFSESTGSVQFPASGDFTYKIDGFAPSQALTGVPMRLDYTEDGVTHSLIGCTFDVRTDGTVTFHLTPEAQQKVNTSGDAVIKIDIEGKFQPNTTKIDFGSGHEWNINVDSTPSVDVSKAGSYHSDDNKVHYRLEVSSVGANNPVVVKDTITGTALSLDSGSIVVKDANGNVVQSSPTVNGNYFELNLGSMSHNQKLYVEYTASVNWDNITGKGTVEQTGNKVQVNNNPEKETNIANSISYNPLSKSVGAVENGEDADTKYIPWTITVNAQHLKNMKGTTITDTIDGNSASYMSYVDHGGISGVKVERLRQGSSTPASTEYLSWAELGVTDPDVVKSWHYTIPQDETENYEYRFTYYTKVDLSQQNGKVYPRNNTGDDNYNTAGASTEVGPGTAYIGVDKAIVPGSITKDKMEWSVTMDVPKGGLNKAVLTDTLPHMDWGGFKFQDTMKEGTLNITGLYTSENYKIKYAKDKFIITFYQDEECTVPGLLPSNNGERRSVVVTFETENDPDWVDHARDTDHTNYVLFEGGNSFVTDQDTGRIPASGINKSGQQLADLVTLPGGDQVLAYRYVVDLYGINDNTDDPIVLTDTFNDTYLMFYDLSAQSALNGMDSYNDQYILEANNYNNKSGNRVVPSVNGGTMTFTIDKSVLPKDSNRGFLPQYKIIYYLVVKDNATMTTLFNDSLLASDRKIHLKNTIHGLDSDDSVTIDYGYDALEKENIAPIGSNVENSTYDASTGMTGFRIVINPLKKDLNSTGESLTLEDEFSGNLSVDYSSIRIYIDDSSTPATTADGVQYNYKGNVGTFTIPDNHKVVIEYNAKVIGNPGDWVHFGNTARMNGYVDSATGYAQMAASSEASMNINSIKVYKYEAGNMMVPIKDIQFTLVDENGNPMVYMKACSSTGHEHSVGDEIVYTTGENGYAEIKPDEELDGFSLQKGITYYLRETYTTTNYAQNNTIYRFTLSDNPNYANYEYHSGDIMKIYNWPVKGRLEIKKTLEGADQLTEEEKKNITFTVTGVYSGTSDPVLVDDQGYTVTAAEAAAQGYTEPFSLNLTLADFKKTNGSETYTYVMEDLVEGEYTVTETGWTLDGYDYTGTTTTLYEVNTDGTSGDAITSGVSDKVATVAIEQDHPRRVEYVNRYDKNPGAEVIIRKINREDGSSTTLNLYGAKFRLEKLNGETGEYETVTSGSVDAEGLFSIPYANKDTGVKLAALTEGTYRITEVEAPANYTIVGDGSFTFTVTKNGDNYDVANGTGNDANVVEYTQNTNTFTVNNKVKHSYTITKVDGANVSVKLAGAVFTAYEHVYGNTPAQDIEAINAGTIQPIRTYTTNDKGQFEILANDLTEGETAAYRSDNNDNHGSRSYFILETTAPNGYALPNNQTGKYFYFGDKPEDQAKTKAVNLKDYRYSQTVTNDLIDLTVQKAWKTLDGADMQSKDVDEIEFTLYQTEIKTALNSDGTRGEEISRVERQYPDDSTIYTIEKDSAGNWNALTIGAVPVSGEKTKDWAITYTYRVEENVPDGYQVEYGSANDGRTLSIINKPEGTSVEAVKVWTGEISDELKAKGTSLVLQRKPKDGSGEWTDYTSRPAALLPNTTRADGTAIDINSREAWTARWDDLPKEYVYRIREVLQNGPGRMTDAEAQRFDIDYSANNANGVSSIEDGQLIVTNHYRATSIKVKKVWVGVPQSVIENCYLQFRLFRRLKNDSSAAWEANPANSTIQVNQMTDWAYEWKDLDSDYIYTVGEFVANSHLTNGDLQVVITDDEGNELDYTINDGVAKPSAGIESGEITITNIYTGGNFAVQKQWLELAGNVMDEAEVPDMTVTGEIWRKIVNENGEDVTSAGFPAKYDDFTLSQGEGWRKEYPELETDAGSGNKYVYYVKEDTVNESAGGFTLSYVNNNGVNTGTISIINTQRGDVVNVEKTWQTAEGSAEWPAGVSIEVKLIKRRPNGQMIELTGENKPAYYKEHTGETWSDTQTLDATHTSYMWENLDALLPGQTYEVVELSAGGNAVAEGKVTAGGKTYFVLGGTAIDGKAKLMNVEETGIHFEKSWRVPDSITFPRPDGAVVASAYLNASDEVTVLPSDLAVTVQLHRYVGDNDDTYNFTGSEIAAHTVTLSGSTWSADWNNLPAAFVNDEGSLVPYVYTAEEISVTVPTSIMSDAEGNPINIKDVFKATSTTSADGKTITMLNTMASDDDYYLSVTKTWRDGNNNVVTDEGPVEFQLVRDTSVTTVGGGDGHSVSILIGTHNGDGELLHNQLYNVNKVKIIYVTTSDQAVLWTNGNEYNVGDEITPISKTELDTYYWNQNWFAKRYKYVYEVDVGQDTTIYGKINDGQDNTGYIDVTTQEKVQKVSVSAEEVLTSHTTTTAGQVMKPDPDHAGKYVVDETGNYTFTLNPNQTINFKNLPYLVEEGSTTTTYKYTVVETTTGAFSTTVTYADGKTYYDPAPASGDKGVDGSVTITNQKTTVNEYGDATLSLKKVKKGTTDPIENVLFTLTSGETAVASGVTDANGELTLTIPGSLLGKHNGAGDTTTTKTFTLTETVPEGYIEPTENPWTVTVTANGATVTETGGVTTTRYNWQVTSVGALTGNAGVYTIENEKEASLTVNKSFTGATLTDSEKANITFTVTGQGLSAGGVSKTYDQFTSGSWVLTQNDGIVAGETYTVVETNANINKYTRVTTISVNGGAATGADATITSSVLVDGTTGLGSVSFFNDYTKEPVEVSGTKTWVDTRTHNNANEITLKLYRKIEGQPDSTYQEITSGYTFSWNGSTYTYAGLDKYVSNNTPATADDEKAYVYKVEEYAVNVTEGGQTVQYDKTANGNDFTNTELTEIFAKKTWSGANDWPQDMSVTLELQQFKGNIRQTGFAATATSNGNDTSVTINSQQMVQWTNLPKYYLDGSAVREYTYKVYETDVKYNGVDLATTFRTVYTVTGEGTPTDGRVTIDNTPTTTTVTGTKTWLANAAYTMSNPTLLLTRTTATNSTPEVVYAEGTNPLQPTWDENGGYTYTGLRQYSPAGEEYTYAVRETGFTVTVPDQNGGDGILYTYTVAADNTVTCTPAGGPKFGSSKDDYNFTNTELMDITVRKVWTLNGSPVTGTPKAFDGRDITSISFDLYQKTGGGTATGDKQGTYTVDADHGWTVTIPDLPKYVMDNGTLKGLSYYLDEIQDEKLAHYNTTIAITGTTTPVNAVQSLTETADVTITNSLFTVSLPATGGVGTGVVYGAGAALMLLAVLGLVLRSRKRSDGEGIR